MNTSVWFPILAGFAWKSSIVLGVAWMLSLVLRNRSAAMRHLVWTAASAAVLALPLFSMSLPALRVPSFRTIAPQVAALFVTNSSAQAETPSAAEASRRVVSAARGGAIQLDWRDVVLIAWMMGAAASIAQMLFAFAGLWRTRRSSRLSPYAALGAELAHELKLDHAIPILETALGTMPMTCGFLRPAILLPSEAATWPEERLRVVLLHELAHVQRGDVAAHLLARVALIPNWWNPLAWLAWREFLKERERATDDLVLSTGAPASDYAGHLLDIARSMQTVSVFASASVAMARRSELEGRLVAILDSRTNRRAVRRATVVAAVAVAVALIAPFAAVRAQDQAPQAIPSDIDATIRAAIAQNNYDMLDKPAEALESARQFDSAKKLLDAALTIRERVSGASSVAYGIGLIQLADLEKSRDQAKQAVPLYSRAVEILGNKPEAAPALMFLGIDQLAQKAYAQAIDAFTKAQNVDSHQAAMAQMWMALTREREQNPVEADSLYRSALAVVESNTDHEATIMEMYSRFLSEQGRSDESKNMRYAVGQIRRKPGRESKVPRIGGGVLPPKLNSKIEPAYTEEARVAKYQGTAVLQLEVGADGLAHNIYVVKGLGFGLDQNAIAAVSQWRFQPGTKDGAPIAVQATVEVNFKLL
jgi:TonB family protein